MLVFPEIKPYLFQIGPLQVRWYGLMYLFGILTSYFLVNYQIKKKSLPIKREEIESLFFYIVLGLIIGARIGYVVFYNLQYYLENPFSIIAVWHGGMSFHGGLIGTLAGGFLFYKKKRFDFWLMTDTIIATAPIAIGFGRIGNFINGELYGRVTNVPWGMIFPYSGGLPRHPSQIYEFFLEGVVLFLILWFGKERIKTKGGVFCLFLIFYGVFRFFVEFFREPDPQLGFIVSFLTMGQILCLAMVLAGMGLYVLRRKAT